MPWESGSVYTIQCVYCIEYIEYSALYGGSLPFDSVASDPIGGGDNILLYRFYRFSAATVIVMNLNMPKQHIVFMSSTILVTFVSSAQKIPTCILNFCNILLNISTVNCKFQVIYFQRMSFKYVYL